MTAAVTLVSDPNDGACAVFIDGRRVIDSGDDDVSIDPFWPDAIAALVEAFGGTFSEEVRYRPSKQDGYASMEGFIEYDSYWPDTLDGMGPVEERIEEPEGELTSEELDPNAEWNGPLPF